MNYTTKGKLIFRYPGGKSKISVRKKILTYFPDAYEEYREIMVGGGGIFFTIPNNINRWINDIDLNLMLVYQTMQNDANNFINLCRQISAPQKDEPLTSSKPNGKPIYNARLKKIFDNLAYNTECNQALRYLFIHRTVWGGRVNYEIPSRMYYSNPNGWNIIHTKQMEVMANKLQDVNITHGDYKTLLEKSGSNVLIYIDPPYYKNTQLNNNSRLYRYNFEEIDHIRLYESITKCNHKIVLSYDNHPYICNLYKNFNIYKEEWKYCGTSNKQKRVGQELIITNF